MKLKTSIKPGSLVSYKETQGIEGGKEVTGVVVSIKGDIANVRNSETKKVTRERMEWLTLNREA